LFPGGGDVTAGTGQLTLPSETPLGPWRKGIRGPFPLFFPSLL